MSAYISTSQHLLSCVLYSLVEPGSIGVVFDVIHVLEIYPQGLDIPLVC